MKRRELNRALRWINKVLIDPRVGPDQRDQLLKARRGLKAIARSGKVDRRKVYRFAEIVAKVLLEIVER